MLKLLILIILLVTIHINFKRIEETNRIEEENYKRTVWVKAAREAAERENKTVESEGLDYGRM